MNITVSYSQVVATVSLGGESVSVEQAPVLATVSTVGLQGPQGVPLSPQGTWNPATSYSYLDFVTWFGSSYLCINENGAAVGVSPDDNDQTDWVVLAGGTKWCGAWSVSTEYYTGALVYYNGNIYRASMYTLGRAPGGGPTVNPWLEYSPQGDPGPVGDPGLVWLGSWDSNAIYHETECVSYGGSSYVAIAESYNARPDLNLGTKWDLLAEKGADGADGAIPFSVSGFQAGPLFDGELGRVIVPHNSTLSVAFGSVGTAPAGDMYLELYKNDWVFLAELDWSGGNNNGTEAGNLPITLEAGDVLIAWLSDSAGAADLAWAFSGVRT